VVLFNLLYTFLSKFTINRDRNNLFHGTCPKNIKMRQHSMRQSYIK